MLSSHFRVTEYQMKEINIYPIKCQWTFLNPDTDEIIEETSQKSMLFGKKASYPTLKSINFPKDAKVDVKLFYDPVPECGRELLGHYIIHRRAPEHK